MVQSGQSMHPSSAGRVPVGHAVDHIDLVSNRLQSVSTIHLERPFTPDPAAAAASAAASSASAAPAPASKPVDAVCAFTPCHFETNDLKQQAVESGVFQFLGFGARRGGSTTKKVLVSSLCCVFALT